LRETLSLVVVGGAALAAGTLTLVGVLSLRALRRGIGLEAELKASSFAFKLRLLPTARPDDRAAVPDNDRPR
jgi:hypothetical protein